MEEDYYDEDEYNEEDDDSGMMLMIEDGVLKEAPEMIQIEKREAEILDAFLNENPDIRERIKEFAEKNKQTD